MELLWFTKIVSATLVNMTAGSLKIVEVTDYWPHVSDDLSQVSWSHATNSHHDLDEALTSDVMMIEADVSIGPDGQPIMAHPPATTSDLTLQNFLDLVIAVSPNYKGCPKKMVKSFWVTL